MLDIGKLLRELREELARLETSISVLEKLSEAKVAPKSKRGRKSMGAAERLEVSERMKKYWASRRKPSSD